MFKIPKQEYTAEFKELAVKQVRSGRGIAAVARELGLVEQTHAQYKAAYGSPRMYRELRERGYQVSNTRVERLMREHDLRARHKRRFKATTDSKHALPVADNVLARDFSPPAPNRVWTADLTYVWTDEGSNEVGVTVGAGGFVGGAACPQPVFP